MREVPNRVKGPSIPFGYTFRALRDPPSAPRDLRRAFQKKAGPNLIGFARESRADTHSPSLFFDKGSSETASDDLFPKP